MMGEKKWKPEVVNTRNQLGGLDQGSGPLHGNEEKEYEELNLKQLQFSSLR